MQQPAWCTCPTPWRTLGDVIAQHAPGRHPEVRLPPELTQDGFRVDIAAGSLRLVHDCGNSIGIWPQVTDRQLQWCREAHRCGPDGSQWHIGTAETPWEWHPRSSPAHLARTRSGRRRRWGGA